MAGWEWQIKHWSALKTGPMPAEFTSFKGENGFLGSGSIGGTACGCCAQVSHVPSSSETRRRVSLKRAASLAFRPGTGLGMAVAGFGRGPGSLALNSAETFCVSRVDASIKAKVKLARSSRLAGLDKQILYICTFQSLGSANFLQTKRTRALWPLAAFFSSGGTRRHR